LLELYGRVGWELTAHVIPREHLLGVHKMETGKMAVKEGSSPGNEREINGNPVSADYDRRIRVETGGDKKRP